MSSKSGPKRPRDMRAAPYEVGYGKPPVEHRFPKGKSPNPNGRPKKKKLTLGGKPLFPLDYGLQLTNHLLMEEAYRLVSIREGDQVLKLPAIQAVARAMGVSALKGNRMAQRNLLELVQRVETSDREAREESAKAVMKYKADATQILAKARAAGRPEPEILPHPDDIIIDSRTGSIFLCGPENEEEKKRLDKRLQAGTDMQEEVSFCAKNWRKAAAGRKATWLDFWHHAQKLFDIVNDNLPVRYRAELNDRSYASGASQPGSWRQVEWPSG